MAVPKRKTPRSQDALAAVGELAAGRAGRSLCPQLRRGEAAAQRVRQLRHGTAVARSSTSTEYDVGTMSDSTAITVAVDAMGGDRAPAEIVAGALDAVGRARRRGPARRPRGRVRAARSRRRRPRRRRAPRRREVDRDGRRARGRGAHEEGLVGRALRGGGARRAGRRDGQRRQHRRHDGRALLRIGRIRGHRPARRSRCRSRCRVSHPQLLVDGGATVDCAPEWLVQFARMGREYARARWDIERADASGLLSNGEEAGKGDELRKTVFDLLRKEAGFVGNVEGSDFMQPGRADVDRHRRLHRQRRAEDASRRALRSLADARVRRSSSRRRRRARRRRSCCRCCSRRPTAYDPDLTGGAVLLGVKGVCVISHGSSSAPAIVNAARRRGRVRAAPTSSSSCGRR